MSVGPDKIRRRSTFAIREFTCELKVTRDQVAIFDAFFQDTLKGGSEVFEVTHPRTGDTIDARMKGDAKYKPLAPRDDGTEYWVITFEMETFPPAAAIVAPPEPGSDLRGSGFVPEDSGEGPSGGDSPDDDMLGHLLGVAIDTTETGLLPADYLYPMWGDPFDVAGSTGELEGLTSIPMSPDPHTGPDATQMTPGGISGVFES